MPNNIIEVSILGGSNAYGESIVIHDGQDNWFIVDSFVDGEGNPAPLAYLNSLGVDLNHVKRIIASHWDNDHINGLVPIIKACPQAEFWCSSAYNNDEFFCLLEADKAIQSIARSLNIFDEVINHLASKGELPREASANQIVWRDSPGSELIALSPSPRTIHDSRAQWIKFLALSSPNRRIPKLIPNDCSVVLHFGFKVAGVDIILGADLEVTSDHQKGWHAIVNSSLCPTGVILLKVSHHGSENGFLKEFWDKKLANGFIAAVTPFATSKLPKSRDISRILSYTSSSFITASPRLTKRAKFNKPADKLLERIGKVVWDASPGSYGQIKLTFDINQSSRAWGVALKGSASYLARYA